MKHLMQTAKSNVTKHDEKEEYNDKCITAGSSLSIQNQRAEVDIATTLLNNKTLVYHAGKGVKPNQNQLEKKK